MAKLEFNTYEIQIGETKSGDEVVQFRNGFDEDFINQMKEAGVKKVIKRDEEGEDEKEE